MSLFDSFFLSLVVWIFREFFQVFFHLDSKGAKLCGSSRFRKNEPTLAIGGVDTAENEVLKLEDSFQELGGSYRPDQPERGVIRSKFEHLSN